MNTESLDPEAEERMTDLDSSGSVAPSTWTRLGAKKWYLLAGILLAGIVVGAVWTSLSSDQGSVQSQRAQVSTAISSTEEMAAHRARALTDDAASLKRPARQDAVLAQEIDAKIAESEDRTGQRLDQLSHALRSIEGQFEVVLTEMRNHPASTETQKNSAAAADGQTAHLRQQAKNRDGEVATLRQELAAREKVIANMTEQTRRLAKRPALPGWSVVGLTARSAAFRDLNGRTRVVATGEVIVDDVKLLGIDTASNRVNTTAGEMIYLGDTR